MRKFLVILTAFIFYVVTFSASKALIIYVSQFKNSEITPLKYAKNDAEHFKETLIKLGLVPDENITFLENPTYVEMKVAIKKFFKTAKSSDVIYFFYSGHGYYDEKHSKTYFIPYDTDPSYFQDTAYSIEDNLKELLLETKAKVFMFVDACYSGSIGKDKPLRFKHFSRESLKEIASRSNVALILSSSSDETSKEDDKLKGGVFTYYLIEGLKGKANLNGDEEITLKELAEYVKEKVSEETMNSQHPQMIASASIEDTPVAIDYSKVELKALEKLKRLSKISEDIKTIVGKIVMQSPEKDNGIESKIRKYIRNFGLGKIEADYLVDFITSNLDKLQTTVNYVYTQPSTQPLKSKGSGLIKIHIEENEASKDAIVMVNGIEKPVENTVIFEDVPAGNVSIIVDGPYMKRYETQIKLSEFETKEISITPEKALVGLKVDSDPQGADIYIDGKKLPDKTPYVTKVPVGKHEIVVKKSGYVPEKRTVDFKKGQVYKLEDIKLKRKPKELNVTCPTFMMVDEEKSCEINAVYYPYKVEKVSYSELNVTISGDSVKFSNGVLKAVSSGKAVVKFEYRGVSEEREIEVYYGKLTIKSQPNGADVYINDNYKGKTPISVYVEDSNVKVTLKKNGYETFEKWVQIDRGFAKLVSYKLIEKLQYIEANIPSKLTVGEEEKLRVEAVKYHTKEQLNLWEYNVQIEGNAVEYTKDGKLIAKRPGTAKLRIKYKDQVLEKVVQVILGSLKITSTPSNAKVYIDLVYKGLTPISVDVTQRSLLLRVEKNGYETYSKYITFRPGDKKELHITLSEKIKNMEVNIPKHMVVGDEVELNVVITGYHAQKVLSAREYSVYISDDSILEYQQGKLIAKNPGIAEITIKYGNRISVHRTVNVYYASLYILSQPSVANIYMNGKFVGTTPKRIYIDEDVNKVNLKLTKEGYKLYTKAIYISYGAYKTVYANLEPKISKIEVHAPKEMKLGDTIYKYQIGITVKYANGTTIKTSGNAADISASGSLDYEYGRIVAKKLGTGYISVNYKGHTASTSIRVYKSVRVTSDPPDADIYTEYGGYLGKTPTEIKLYSDHRTIKIKKEDYNPQTIHISSYQNKVHVELHLPFEDKVKPLLENGKLKEIAGILKTNDSEKEKLLSAVKTFDETKIKSVNCSTIGCKLYKKYLLKYLQEVKKAIKEKNAKKAAKLLEELYPEISKALQSSEKPWSKALNAASDRLIEIESLVDNARYEGSEIKIVEKVTWNVVEKDLKDLYMGIVEANVGYLYTASTTPSWYQNINVKVVAVYYPIGPIKVGEKGIAKGTYWYLGIGEFGGGTNHMVDTDYWYNYWYSYYGVGTVGIGYYMTKPLKEDSNTWWFLNAGIGTNSMTGIPVGVHLRAEAKLGWSRFYINLGAEGGYSYVGIEDSTTDSRFRWEWSSYFTFYIGLGFGDPLRIKPASSIKFPYADIH